MNVFRRIAIKRAIKSHNINMITREMVDKFANVMFKTMIISSGIGIVIGAIQPRGNILDNIFIYGVIGFTAPITIPIITIHSYLTYQESKN